MENEKKLVPVVRLIMDACSKEAEFQILSDYEKFLVLSAVAEFYRKCSM